MSHQQNRRGGGGQRGGGNRSGRGGYNNNNRHQQQNQQQFDYSAASNLVNQQPTAYYDYNAALSQQQQPTLDMFASANLYQQYQQYPPYQQQQPYQQQSFQPSAYAQSATAPLTYQAAPTAASTSSVPFQQQQVSQQPTGGYQQPLHQQFQQPQQPLPYQQAPAYMYGQPGPLPQHMPYNQQQPYNQKHTPHSSGPTPTLKEVPSRTLFIRNIAYELPEAQLRSMLEEFGELKELYALPKKKGIMFATYFDIRCSVKCKQEMQGRTVLGRNIDVHFSLPKDSDLAEKKCDRDKNQGTLLLSLEFDDKEQGEAIQINNEELKKIFAQFGEVKCVRDFKTFNRKRFIEYYDSRHMLDAFDNMHGMMYLGGKIRLEFAWDSPQKVREDIWRQSLEIRTKREEEKAARHGGMGSGGPGMGGGRHDRQMGGGFQQRGGQDRGKRKYDDDSSQRSFGNNKRRGFNRNDNQQHQQQSFDQQQQPLVHQSYQPEPDNSGWVNWNPTPAASSDEKYGDVQNMINFQQPTVLPPPPFTKPSDNTSDNNVTTPANSQSAKNDNDHSEGEINTNNDSNDKTVKESESEAHKASPVKDIVKTDIPFKVSASIDSVENNVESEGEIGGDE